MSELGSARSKVQDDETTPVRTRASRTQVWRDFADYTSAHGIADLFRLSSAWVWRLIWTVAIVCCWSLCIYSLNETLIDYAGYPTTTSIKVQFETDAKFPAVSLCNVNALRYTLVKRDFNGFIAWVNTMGANVVAQSTKGWEDVESQAGDTRTMVLKAFTEHVFNEQINISTHGHQMQHMLLECVYQGRVCRPSDFVQWEHPKFGNCYTFVASSFTNDTFFGPDFGLSMSLFAEEYNYMPWVTDSVGFRLQIHPPEYVAFPEDYGLTISPGLQTSISLRGLELSRQPLPYDDTDCETTVSTDDSIYDFWLHTFSEHITRVNYTTQQCIKTCLVREIVERCGCIDASILTRSHASLAYGTGYSECQTSDRTQFACTKEVEALAVKNEICLDCSSPCYEQRYETNVASSMWPRLDYFRRMVESWLTKLPGLCHVMDEIDATFCDNPLAKFESLSQADRRQMNRAIRESAAKVDIYFEELNHQVIAESPTYSLPSLLSSLGGTLGLYSGLSLLALVQVVELAYKLVWPPFLPDHH